MRLLECRIHGVEQDGITSGSKKVLETRCTTTGTYLALLAGARRDGYGGKLYVTNIYHHLFNRYLKNPKNHINPLNTL